VIVSLAAIDDHVRLFVVGHFGQRKGIAQNILRDPFELRAIVFGNDCAIIDTESTVPPTADLIGCMLPTKIRPFSKISIKGQYLSNSILVRK
jgi:hypothetical protein